jgi:hypothetical protein
MASLIERVSTMSIRGMLTNKATVYWMAAIVGHAIDAPVQSGSRALSVRRLVEFILALYQVLVTQFELRARLGLFTVR